MTSTYTYTDTENPDMSDRDELRATLSNTICNASNYTKRAQPHLLGSDMSAVLDKTADAILAAGYRKPRTITTVEELNALRVGSVVIDADEYVGRKERNSTRLPDWAVTLHKSSKDAHALTLPATVLWEPLP